MPNWGGSRPGGGRPKGTGLYGEPTRPIRATIRALELIKRHFPNLKEFWVWVVAQLETNEKKNDA